MAANLSDIGREFSEYQEYTEGLIDFAADNKRDA
jgi:hypothetical protein